MDIIPYVPIIVEATKFFLNEVGEWFDDVRSRLNKSESNTDLSETDFCNFPFSQEYFEELSNNLHDITTLINPQLVETNAYVIQGLVEQIQIHRKNLVDLEKAEAEYGILTPVHVKRGIEHEARSILVKSQRLKSLLLLVYRADAYPSSDS